MELFSVSGCLIFFLVCLNVSLIYVYVRKPRHQVPEPPRSPSGRSARDGGAAESSTSRRKLAEQDTEKNNPEVKNMCLFFAQFLKEFPGQKQTIEQCITSLWEMADQVDKTHKNCAITSVVANVTAASSEVLKMGSQFLAPSSVRGSLGIAITGMSLELCGTVTDVCTNIFESFYKAQKKEKTKDLLKEGEKSLRMLMGLNEMNFISELPLDIISASDFIKYPFLVGKTATSGKQLYTHIKAMKCVRENPDLIDLAMKVAAGQGETEEVKEVWKIFQGTPLGQTKLERMQNAAWSLCSILGSIKNIAQAVIHLKDGAKDEMAVNIRDKANQLEYELQRLNKLYEGIKEEDITEEESCLTKPKSI